MKYRYYSVVMEFLIRILETQTSLRNLIPFVARSGAAALRGDSATSVSHHETSRLDLKSIQAGLVQVDF